MSYDGVEVDMLNLGNADSILVTSWTEGIATRVLIDGGNASDADTILAFLKQRSIASLDHIVCTHPHDDHAGGLVGIVQSKDVDFGQAWMHLPWKHIDADTFATALNEGEATARRVVRIVRASVQSAQALENAIIARGKDISEPFQDDRIGFLTVCGPSQAFYEQLLQEFTDIEKLKTMEEAIASRERQELVETLFEEISKRGELVEARETGLGMAPTEPENNSSTILGMKRSEDILLFTADSGVEALLAAKQAYKLANLRWMQIPHHGSRRNVNEELIAYFNPKTAFVSAEGSRKHPRRAVVNAFKDIGSDVFSTHYPTGTNLWFHLGEVPGRSDYSSATPLYEAENGRSA